MKQLLTLAAGLFLAIALTSCAANKPKAAFTTPTQKFTAPAKINFTNTSLKAEKYEWDFGDGSPVSAEVNPTHRYSHSGNYTVLLKATAGSKTVIRKQMVQVTAPERCLIEIETDYGTMIAELFSSTPQHRDNFIKLADEGYYNDLLLGCLVSIASEIFGRVFDRI